MGKKNFYAVRVGRSGPAIYRTWDECKAQVSGHPGSTFQGFVSLPEAEAYLVGAPAPAADGGPGALVVNSSEEVRKWNGDEEEVDGGDGGGEGDQQ